MTDDRWLMIETGSVIGHQSSTFTFPPESIIAR